jgi:hypothetical protein
MRYGMNDTAILVTDNLIQSLGQLAESAGFNRPSDRHDYYEADTDFWKVIRGILRNREKKLIGDFKNSVADSLKEIKRSDTDEEARFHTARLKHMMGFLNTFNRFFNAYMAMERFSLGRITLAGKDKTSHENED